MTSLCDIVEILTHQASTTRKTSPDHSDSSTPGIVSSTHDTFAGTFPKTSVAVPNTPSARTGPPRSFSFSPLPLLPIGPRSPAVNDNEILTYDDDLEHHFNNSPEITTPFRSAFEDQRTPKKEFPDRIGSKKNGKFSEESWNPLRWLTIDTPKEGKFSSKSQSEYLNSVTTNQPPNSSSGASRPHLRRFNSAPHIKDNKRTAPSRWSRLRSLLPTVVAQNASKPDESVSTSQPRNITDELITGGMCALMLRLWFERDEKGHRRVPILLHHLRIRISDSLHPLDRSKAVFRIECEYANGAARWVIYRQLREFFSLHRHYTFSNAYNRNVGSLPDFPKMSIPYLKFLQREYRDMDKKVGHAVFTRMQREALENYLIDLIRAMMFHPSLNRLAGFLEISALFIAQSQSGGAQYKAGYLKISRSGNQGVGFGPKAAGRKSKRAQKWCAVRESYLVVVDELAELTVYDVFLIDSKFNIERPDRYYRHLLHPRSADPQSEVDEKGKGKERLNDLQRDGEYVSTFGSVRSRLSNVFKRPFMRRSFTEGLPATLDGNSSDSASDVSLSHRPSTPMLDPSTNTNPLLDVDERNEKDATGKQTRHDDRASKHTFYIENAQTRLKLYAKNERQMLQWITALEKVAVTSQYTKKHRFDSFAPVRFNVAAQWLVDGRDYFWNLSKAISLAKESIYIHDWWLSPELQMRRPLKGKFRLDKLLQRKAKEGVKIYIIIYQEFSSRTTPTNSNYTKQRMMSLHPDNIFVQRSPSHFQTGTFYWAHHEKICVIDQAIAFMGGLDLCFGRWDTPQHVLVDDPDDETPLSEQIWIGKDYSNARVTDFHTLDKPDEDMYDRSKVPRMPWHDVGLQIVGQPARDLARHFTERWNFLLRIKNHSRVMPCLLPPPDFKPGDLVAMSLTGTCEMQICRSAGPWSLGYQDLVESSIQKAYLKAIQMSEHFVYIENQFFITSTVVGDVKVENKIGDAIVHRIVRAHKAGTAWRCCIMIPVVPGFAFPIDHGDASSLRIIMECQNRTICRGPDSIFGRLKQEGIDPHQYISIFSLRNWGKLRGNVLTTEQVYIHAKICIVDDRLVIIGSANINERSQRGDRDSEVAAVIRDTDMMDCTMAGKPFKVGRFAHSLRVRLMREHLGVDVDAMHEEELMSPDSNFGTATGDVRGCNSEYATDTSAHRHSQNNGVKKTGLREVVRGLRAAEDVGHMGAIGQVGVKNENLGGTVGDRSREEERASAACSIVPSFEDESLAEATSSDSQDESHSGSRFSSKTWTLPTHTPHVDPHGFEDPIAEQFWKNVWVACAVHNTEIYRKVFRAVPDDLVTTWKQYKEVLVYHERLSKPVNDAGHVEPAAFVPGEAGDGALRTANAPRHSRSDDRVEPVSMHGPDEETVRGSFSGNGSHATNDRDMNDAHSKKASGRQWEPFDRSDREEMERLLGELRGHLILYPTRFLENEDIANNFLFNADRLLPLLIYD